MADPLTNRYSRQLLLPQLGKAGQQKLKSARVLIVGLGGLGCPAAQYLAAAGVGHLGLVDPDVVQVSNLHRQILYGEGDIGQTKVDVAKQRLLHLNPHATIATQAEKFTTDRSAFLAQACDLVLDCTDNFAARDAINAYCVQAKKPSVFASLYRFEGMLTVFDTTTGAGCYRCLYSESSEAIQNCAEAGVIGMLPGIMGAMQALEAIKIITGAGEVLNRQTLVYDGLNQTARKFIREKKADCSVCG
ncbi:HesA/MoeB/ThiF family protein [Turneriella parva]|uniref:Molybdopterin-synthase adenylyltransferase n=1 Tax=Turneriella parva (strain ATCC BAA-1111 / DSM 21527 / NCTC 11395 / H) TaxID=869212 RepID=I4B773_TURPD|nr:HesA/MoeB/ThiF family protein [Turneriella parva]AFM13130.1 UBA/THIF-type NAD/FAD binding protein [Turneriella parva DSM 21527]